MVDEVGGDELAPTRDVSPPPKISARGGDAANDPARRAALFAERGFARTTVRDIAVAAGVAVQTIYSTFGSKDGVLAGMVDLLDEESGVTDLFEPLQSTEDPLELVALYARAVRQIKERTGDIVAVLSSGAADDEEVAATWREGMRRRHAGIDFVIDRLAEMKKLPRGLDRARAADIAAAIVTEEPWRVLVEERGWTFDDYERWLTEALEDVFLRPRR